LGLKIQKLLVFSGFYKLFLELRSAIPGETDAATTRMKFLWQNNGPNAVVSSCRSLFPRQTAVFSSAYVARQA
jgi:hypothetical protein